MIGVAAKVIGSLPSAFFVALIFSCHPLAPIAGTARAARLSWPSSSTFAARVRRVLLAWSVRCGRDAGTGFAALLDVSGLPAPPPSASILDTQSLRETCV